MKNTLFIAAAAVLMAGTASAQEVGGAVGQIEGRDTVVSARYQTGLVEFTADTLTDGDVFDTTLVGVNLVKDFALTERLSVYALGGLGYAWSPGFETATYAYGGGATFALTDRVELDARVREVEAFRSDTPRQTIATLGFNVKF
jgi:opacity protein-like surface antigen